MATVTVFDPILGKLRADDTPGGTPVTSVSGTANRITSTGGSTPVLDIAATYVGQTSITTLGTIATGTWSATAIAKAKGGTGVDISSAALVLGTASTTAGQLTLSNATNAFTQTLRGTNPSASITYDLPTTAPTAGQVLQSTAPSAGVATLSWATAGGGITVGTTTISSGTTGSIGMNIGGVYTESISYRAQQATPFSTAFGFESHSSGSFSGVKNTSIGYQAGKAITTGTDNTCIGYTSGTGITTGQYNTVIGSNSASPSTTSSNTWIGYNAGPGVTASNVVAIGAGSGSYAGTQSVFIGNNTGTNSSGADYAVVIGNSSNTGYGTRGNIVIGYGLPTGNITASHQGVLGTTDANGYVDNWYFNGVTAASPYSVVLNACGGSSSAGGSITIAGGAGAGTNKAGGNVVIQAGLATGTDATDGGILFKTYPVTVASGTGSQSLVTALTIKKNGILDFPTTITTVGTTGNQTINKQSGRVNIAAAGTTVTVTNNLVTANSNVFCTIVTNDTTARIANVVPASGSFTINIVACTAEVAIAFLVTNQ